MSAAEVTLDARSDKSDIRRSSCSCTIGRDILYCSVSSPLEAFITLLPWYQIKRWARSKISALPSQTVISQFTLQKNLFSWRRTNSYPQPILKVTMLITKPTTTINKFDFMRTKWFIALQFCIFEGGRVHGCWVVLNVIHLLAQAVKLLLHAW